MIQESCKCCDKETADLEDGLCFECEMAVAVADLDEYKEKPCKTKN